jgi:predicted RNA binding protein YcfA (HicA-like mRNA interferase family)
MRSLPALTGKKVIKALRKLGFVQIRQKGSHVVMKHLTNGRLTVVPIHAGKTIKKPLLKSIIEQDTGVTIKEFLDCL